MKAWGEQLDPSGKVRFIADPGLAFTDKLDLSFDGAAIFGGPRGKRYALLVEDGKVKEAFVEPDNTGVNGEYQILYISRNPYPMHTLLFKPLWRFVGCFCEPSYTWRTEAVGGRIA